jgi:hypothetical protein
MLEAKIEGVEAFAKKVETLSEQVKSLHTQMPLQLVEWQTQDMRRQYPNIQVDQTTESVEATTMIWPRSRLELEPGYQRPKRPTVKKAPRQYNAKGVGRPPPSTRPLLRTELFIKLVDRMQKLLEAVKWQ